VEVPALEEMEITVLDDETSGDGGTVVIRVQVADLTADYRISMQEIGGQWRIHDYQVEEVVEAMGR
jgi:ABC-type transporter MlaC component